MEIFLQQNGFTNLEKIGSTKSIVRMLTNQRANAWFTVRPEKPVVVSVRGKQMTLVAGNIIHTESTWIVGGKSFVHTNMSRRFTQQVKGLVKSGRLLELKRKLRPEKK